MAAFDRPAAVGLVLLLVAACGETSTPDSYLVYDVEAPGEPYRLVARPITTLENPTAGKGRVAQLRAGGDMIISTGEITTEQQVLDAIRVTGDAPPDIAFGVDEDGVAVPWDFASLMLLTVYHHMERASAFFESVGVPASEIGQLPVYYFPEVRADFLILLPVPLLTDNAAYVVTMDAFLLPPRFFLTDGVPLFANRGVIVHEYGHLVANRLLWNDQRVLPYFLGDWPNVPRNELRSLDEGLADLFGALQTKDPDFIAPSLEGEALEVDRDLTVERAYDTSLLALVESGSLNDYDPYPLGSVVASALWTLRGDMDDTQLASAVVAAMRVVAPVSSTFKLADFFNALHAELPASIQAPACARFRQRLPAIDGDLGC